MVSEQQDGVMMELEWAGCQGCHLNGTCQGAQGPLKVTTGNTHVTSLETDTWASDAGGHGCPRRP